MKVLIWLLLCKPSTSWSFSTSRKPKSSQLPSNIFHSAPPRNRDRGNFRWMDSDLGFNWSRLAVRSSELEQLGRHLNVKNDLTLMAATEWSADCDPIIFNRSSPTLDEVLRFCDQLAKKVTVAFSTEYYFPWYSSSQSPTLSTYLLLSTWL